MADVEQHQGMGVAAPSVTTRCRKVTEELTGLRTAVQAIVPGDTAISFHFDERRLIHIDVRDLRDLARAETLLPTIEGGIFSNLRRTLADHHSFRHRLTADVVK